MTRQRVPPLSAFEESPLRREIIEALSNLAVGEVMAYSALSELAGEDIRNAWHLVTSAREALLKEGLVFDVVRTVGIKRLDEDGKVAASEGYLDKTKFAARRATRILRATHLAELSETSKLRFFVAEVRAGAVLQFSAKRTLSTLAATLQAGRTPRELKSELLASVEQFKKGEL
jgi:hypothetical protein